MDNAEFEEFSEVSDARFILESMQSAYDFVTSKKIKDGSMPLDDYIDGLVSNKAGFLEASLLDKQEIENYIGVYKYVQRVSDASTLSEAYAFVSNGCLDERIVYLWVEESLLDGLNVFDSGHLNEAIEIGYFQNCD